MRWEYAVAEYQLMEKWNASKRAEELQKFTGWLNQWGEQHWELVEYEAVPLIGRTGAIGSGKDGLAYLCFWKRPIQLPA